MSHDYGLARITEGVSRAVTCENPTGRPGAGGRASSPLGPGRKGAPCLPDLPPGEEHVLMDVVGAGVIRHVWITFLRKEPEILRGLVLRMWWDGAGSPSVVAPLGDFFAQPHGAPALVDSALVHTGHGPGRSFNAWFPMPFASAARITVTNESPVSCGELFHQVDYEEHVSVPADAGRFHAVYRRENPTTPGRDFVLLDVEDGPGHVVGVVLGVRASDDAWWGEGEVKGYMDGDAEHPTLCGTGLEDYFLSAWGLEEYGTTYSGCPRLVVPEGAAGPEVSCYRWHVLDPIRWRESLRLTVQQIGIRDGVLYERSDDVSAVTYYYLPRPTAVESSC